MTTKKLERLGTEKLSGEVSTSKNDLLNELNTMSHKMIYIINSRKEIKSDDKNYFDNIGYLAQSHLISPLFYLCELARFLNEKEWESVADYWLVNNDSLTEHINKILTSFLKDIEKVNERLDKENKNANRND